MGLIALKRFFPKHHLSLLSDYDYSVTANADVPFEIGDGVCGSSCKGLVYYMSRDGEIIISNLTTRECRVVPPPSMFLSEPSSDLNLLDWCGLGYDPISRDYKLLRSCNRFYTDDELKEKPVSEGWCEVLTELYSFKSNSWRKIAEPGVSIMYPVSVYVAGSCYWTALDNKDDAAHFLILKFELDTESFSRLEFPEFTKAATIPDFHQRPAVYRGLLAALIYSNDWSCSSPSSFNIYVHRDDTWQILFDLKLEGVDRPLGFGDSSMGFVLFLKGVPNPQTRMSELMIYDFHSEKVKGLGIYDRDMIITFFDLKRTRIPGSSPLVFVDNIVQSSEEEMRSMKMKSERKKNKKKVSKLLRIRPWMKMMRR